MALIDLSQPQREALLSLLTIATYGDDHISFAELDAFKHVKESIPWQSGTSMEIFLDEAIAKARDAYDADEATGFIAYHAEVFDNAEARATALQFFADILGSDGATDGEMEMMETARAALTG